MTPVNSDDILLPKQENATFDSTQKALPPTTRAVDGETSPRLMAESMCDSTAAVSVVIPCFRCQDTIERAVGSVVSQTVRPVELILVDDASGDGTREALVSIQDRYGPEWVKLVWLEENGGPSIARNAGWDAASQPYIAFLDADDQWHPRKIEIQYRWMCEHPEVILTGHTAVEAKQVVELARMEVRNVRARRILARELLLTNRFHTPAVMVRRDIPYRFDPEKRRSEDYLLWLTIVLAGEPAWRLDPTLAIYHKPPYGGGGLSGNLWEMEKAELSTYCRLYRRSYLSLLTLSWVLPVSLIKHLRRLGVVAGRRRLLAARDGEDE